MNEARWNALEQELRRTRRSLRFLQRACGTALLLAVSLVFMGQDAPQAKTIEAERFVVRDPGGTVRAELGLQGEQVSLLLNDGAGQTRVRLRYRPLTPRTPDDLQALGGDHALTLLDADGRARIDLGIDPPGPTVVGEEEEEPAEGSEPAPPRGSTPWLTLYSRASFSPEAVVLGVREDGRPSLRLESTGPPTFRVEDGAGNEIIRAP